VLFDVCIHERTERQDRESSASRVLECVVYQDRRHAVPLERLVDLGVNEGDQPGLLAIFGKACQRTVDSGLVALLRRVVVDFYGRHASNATERPRRRSAQGDVAPDWSRRPASWGTIAFAAVQKTNQQLPVLRGSPEEVPSEPG
jgi:hypothetical protein